jgi:predicted CXXCH cytochrome family protein
MKKLNVFLTVSFLLLVSFGYAQTIVGSGHDFKNKSWNAATGEVCIVCHTPHNANTTVADAPLWNHQLSAVASYTMYSSGTMQSVAGQPDGSSKLCLSCHDGTVAMDNFGGKTNGSTANVMTGSTVLGTSLSNDHPISITYDAALATADGGLNDPSVTSGLGGSIAAKMLVSGKMQCSSCHDVHNGAGVAHLLLKSNAGSALCLTCHKK